MRRMAASVVRSTETRPGKRTAAWARPRKRASVRAEGTRAGGDALREAPADRRLTEAAFGAGRRPGPLRTGLGPWGDWVSRSGSRRIIVHGAARDAAPVHLQFYAKAGFTVVWQWEPTARAARRPCFRRARATTPAAAVWPTRRRVRCAVPRHGASHRRLQSGRR